MMGNEFDELHDMLLERIKDNAGLPSSTTGITIVSMHEGKEGQMVMCDPKHDPKEVAARLRVCADALEEMAEAQQ